ncbi:hypothetical protein AYI68_g7729, partial [Smittium mucronatum]
MNSNRTIIDEAETFEMVSQLLESISQQTSTEPNHDLGDGLDFLNDYATTGNDDSFNIDEFIANFDFPEEPATQPTLADCPPSSSIVIDEDAPLSSLVPRESSSEPPAKKAKTVQGRINGKQFLLIYPDCSLSPKKG